MILATLYGRLGADPVERATRNGKTMVTSSLAVNVARRGEPDDTEWYSVAAFGKVAEALLRNTKGDLVCVMGRVERRTWAGSDGGPRQGWSVTVDSLISARTGRPGGAKRQASTSPNKTQSSALGRVHEGPNDDIPF